MQVGEPVEFIVAENTCGDDPEAIPRQTYFRLTLPFGGPVATITYSSEANQLPANMEDWAQASYNPETKTPEEVDLEYFTEFTTESN